MSMLYAEQNSLKRYLLFLIMGICVFSPLSSEIVVTYMHFPLSMPELLLLPLLLFIRPDIKKVSINKSLFGRLFIIWVLLIILGILWGKYTVYAILGCSRGYFYIILFYCIFVNRYCPFSKDDLLYISLGCIIGWLFASLLTFKILIIEEGEAETYGALLSIPVLLSICLTKKKYYLLLVGLVLISATVIFSGVRRLLFVFILSIAVVFLLSFLRKPQRMFKMSIIAVVFGLFMAAALPYVRSSMQDISHVLYSRIFIRSERYLSGEVDSSDQGRFNDIVDLVESFYEYIFPPRGFVSRQTEMDKGVGDYNDLPLKEMFWTFSIPFSFLIFYHYGRRGMLFMRDYIRNGSSDSFENLSILIILFSLFFIDGTFLGFPYATPLTGTCLGIFDRKLIHTSLS